MKNINVKMMFSLFLCFALIAGCSSGKYEVKEPAETGKEEAVSQDEQAEEESTEPAEGEEAAGSDQESLSEESVLGEEEEIQEGQVGTVAFTVCSADDSRAFSGKELTADPVYLQTAVSSEVYFCQKSFDGLCIYAVTDGGFFACWLIGRSLNLSGIGVIRSLIAAAIPIGEISAFLSRPIW